MTKNLIHRSDEHLGDLNDKKIQSQLVVQLEKAKDIATSLGIDSLKNGEWFIKVFNQAMSAYCNNAKAEYYVQKYPGLTKDEIVDVLTRNAARYSSLIGGVVGAAATASEVSTILSSGVTAGVFFGSLGAEMICLSNLQLRLVTDLAKIYEVNLDPEDPEDMFVILSHAVGIKSSDSLANKARSILVKKIGQKLASRTFLKYSVVGFSIAIGSGHNYIATKSLSNIAKSYFKYRGQANETLNEVIKSQEIYDAVFPAAVLHMARVDGDFSAKERELYKAIVSRLEMDKYSQVDLKFLKNEKNLLDEIGKISNDDIKNSLLDTLILMAIYDGSLAKEEQDFLNRVSDKMNICLDQDTVLERMREYQVIVDDNCLNKLTKTACENSEKMLDYTKEKYLKFKDSLSSCKIRPKLSFRKASSGNGGTV